MENRQFGQFGRLHGAKFVAGRIMLSVIASGAFRASSGDGTRHPKVSVANPSSPCEKLCKVMKPYFNQKPRHYTVPGLPTSQSWSHREDGWLQFRLAMTIPCNYSRTTSSLPPSPNRTTREGATRVASSCRQFTTWSAPRTIAGSTSAYTAGVGSPALLAEVETRP
jgi:hypothetical protein